MVSVERKAPGATIRVSIPAAVAYDLGSLKKGIKSLMDRLGHPECFSGVNCGFQLERDFVIDERLKVHAIARTNVADAPAVNPVSASLPGKVSYNIDLVMESIANIADRLGCGACCSGFDIFFAQEQHLLLNNEAQIVG